MLGIGGVEAQPSTVARQNPNEMTLWNRWAALRRRNAGDQRAIVLRASAKDAGIGLGHIDRVKHGCDHTFAGRFPCHSAIVATGHTSIVSRVNHAFWSNDNGMMIVVDIVLWQPTSRARLAALAGGYLRPGFGAVG